MVRLQVAQRHEQRMLSLIVVGHGAHHVVAPIAQPFLTDAAWRQHGERGVFVIAYDADGVGDTAIKLHRLAHRSDLDA